MKTVFFFVFITFFAFDAGAFEFKAGQLKLDLRDYAAVKYAKTDANDKPCAIIKIYTDLLDLKFESNQAVVDVVRKTGECWVYVSPGEKLIKIMKEGFASLPYNITIPIESSKVYVMELRCNDCPVEKTEGYDQNLKLGNYQIESEPPGATISIWGMEDFNAKHYTTPYPISKMLAGPKIITLTLNKYDPVIDTIVIGDKKKNIARYKLAYSYGSVNLSLEPSTLLPTFFVDQVETRTLTAGTPCELLRGTHEIEVKAPHYYPEKVTVMVSAGLTLPLQITLRPVMGRLTVHDIGNADGAELYLNKNPVIQRIPFVHYPIQEGTYTVTAVKPGFEMDARELTVTVLENQEATVSVKMNNTKKKSILLTHPSIAKDWDANKNINFSIENVASTDKSSIWWTCVNQHSYSVSPYTRLRTNGCKICNKDERGIQSKLLSRLITGTSKRFTEVADKKLMSEWAHDLNDILPTEVTSSSHRKINWRCTEGHVWSASISARIRGTNCPKCYSNNRREILLKGKLKVSGLSLFEKYADLKDEWDFEKNLLDPNTLTPNSNYKVYWKCKYGHGWEAAIYNRTGKGSGCPFCTNQTSKIEIYLLCELREIFDKVEWRKKIHGVEADICITDLNIVIEVDGEYWHKDKLEADKKKNSFFELNGYKTIRVRSDQLPDIDGLLVLFNRNDDNAKIAMSLVNLLVIHTKDSKAVKYQSDGVPKGESNYKVMISRLPAPPDELSLLTTNPDVANEWDYEKNMPLTPDLFSKGSNQILWWKCHKNHSW
ncbi:MAG: zinc-ribbon domain-containing protein, partial [Mariniphaga sp.]